MNDAQILEELRARGIARADETPKIELLLGGVSSHVYRVDLSSGQVCVKETLPRLSVKADWRAPVARVHNEAQWLRFANEIVPDCAPTVLAEDHERHLFVMNYFEPSTHHCWKDQLRDGEVDISFAAQVGALIARIHRASAGSQAVERDFDYGEFFMALRLEPYPLYTAKAHPDLAPRIEAIAAGIGRSRIALMHGDFSPKNILAGSNGPIILDAETACYGDPAFDLAFCLNHLLLKCVWRPAHTAKYCASFRALRDAYLADVKWENPPALDMRAAAILSALLLARIDGKSPVEYLTSATDQEFVRSAARSYLTQHDWALERLLRDWETRLAAR
jgi:aminoglycoside phosphotransferase (APT) family kinase protein